jgi:hypothetical protein
MRLPTSGLLRRVNEKRAIEIVRYGIDRGINYLDTAWFYHLGQSEQILGKALRDGYREKVHLVTKLPMPLVRKAEDFDRYLDRQLQRLQTDHLDIYLFHMLNQTQFAKVRKLKLLDRMIAAREQGKIRHIGFSFHDTLPVFKKIIDHYPWDITLVQYNYMDTGIQATTEGLQYAHEKGIAVVVMEPLKGGMLASPPAEAMSVISGAPVQRTPVDWALQFLWNRPEISCVLSGMSDMTMVTQNCDSADRSGIGVLSQEENRVIEELARIYRRKIAVPCTACQYCVPCPAGVDIPQNFALLNNKSIGGEGSMTSRFIQWQVTRGYHRLAGDRKQLSKKGSRGRASLCTRCNACLAKCPQQIAIPDELEKVAAAFEKRKRRRG